MKYYLIVFLLAFSFSVFGQANVYHPFPDSNATWCSMWVASTGCLGGFLDSTVDTYQLNGDTLINGLTYHKLYHYLANYDNCPPPWTSASIGKIYLRQEAIQKKVWIFDVASQHEEIFYDFNLNIGDTIDQGEQCWAYGGFKYKVFLIDSVLINGNYRKRFNYFPLGDSGCISSMVEGIGALHGLTFQPSTCFEYFPYLTSFIENNQALYVDSFRTSTCYDFLLDIDESSNQKILSVYPNPFHSSTLFELSYGFQNAELKVYNSVGINVLQLKINSPITILNRNNLISGFYYFQITNSNQIIANGKLIVE